MYDCVSSYAWSRHDMQVRQNCTHVRAIRVRLNQKHHCLLIVCKAMHAASLLACIGCSTLHSELLCLVIDVTRDLHRKQKTRSKVRPSSVR